MNQISAESLALESIAERRLHPLSWLFVMIVQLKQFIVPLFVLLVVGRGDRNDLWSIVAICILCAYSIWQYYTYRFRIDNDSLMIRSGLLERSLRQIPFARIQNVALHQSLLHRIFRVAEVRLESAGGIKPEAEMRVLSLNDAMALEALVRRRNMRSTAAQPVDDAGAEHSEVLLTLPLSEVIRLGLISNRGMFVVGGTLAVLGQINPRFLTKILEIWLQVIFGYVVSYGRGHEIAAVLSMMMMFVIAIRMFSIGLALLHYSGFKLEQFDRRLTLERGLLARLRTSSPHRRIQTWTLHEGILHRLFRRRSLEVTTAVLENGSHHHPRSLRELAPVATAQRCDALIRHLLPRAQWPITHWRTLHRLAGWRLFLPHLCWVSVLGTFAYLRLGPLGALLIGFWLPWAGYAAWRQVRFAGYSIDDLMIATRKGWWKREWRMAEIGKLQTVTLSRSPLDRMLGMATLLMDTAGGMGMGSPLRLRYLSEADARALQQRLIEKVSREKLRW